MNICINNYQKKAIKSTHFIKRKEYFEPCDESHPKAIKKKYTDLKNGELFPHLPSFADMLEALEDAIPVQDFEADKGVIEFMRKYDTKANDKIIIVEGKDIKRSKMRHTSYKSNPKTGFRKGEKPIFVEKAKPKCNVCGKYLESDKKMKSHVFKTHGMISKLIN